MKKIFYLILCVLFSCKLNAQTESSITIQDTSVKFACVNTHFAGPNTTASEMDDFVWTFSGALYVSHFYLQFNFPTLPSNAIIDSAYLSLYADPAAVNGYAASPTYGTANATGIYKVTSSWSGSTITWNAQPTHTSVDSVVMPESYRVNEDYVNNDVTAIVKDMLVTGNYGFLIKILQETAYYNTMIFYSPLCGISGKQPKLVISYRVPLPPITGARSDSLYIDSTVALSDATPGGIWSSSSPQVASVDSKGKVTAKSLGTTTISYSLGNANASIYIHTHWVIQQVPPKHPGIFDYTNSGIRNYVRTYIPQTTTTNADNIALTSQSSYPSEVTTNYFDGLGRPMQDVKYDAVTAPTLANDADMVKAYVYDNVGRETYQFLPYSINDGSNKGKLKTTPATQLSTQYISLYPNDMPYTKTVFDNSPLNRPIQIFPPGQSWVGSNRGTSYQYATNTASSNIAIWTVATTNTSPPVFAGVYPSGALYQTTTTDEDGHIIYEYKDKLNRTVFKRQLIDIQWTIQQNGAFYLTYADTYYIYDDLGHLRWVLTPEAVNQSSPNLPTSWTISQAILNGLCYRYFYDSRGRMIEKQLPGKTTEYMVYDADDRIVFSQDGNDATGNSPDVKLLNNGTGGNFWKFNCYDPLDRILATGIYQPATISWTQQNLQAAVNTGGISSTSDLLYYISNGYYSTEPSGYPGTMTNATVLTENFYDNYTNTALSGKTFTTAYNTELPTANYTSTPAVSNQTRGMLTGTSVKVINPNNVSGLPTNPLITADFYDYKGELIQSQSDNHCTGKDILTNEYNFGGYLTGSVLHSTNPQATLTGLTNQSPVQTTDIVKEYTVDKYSGVTTEVSQSINNDAFETLSYNYYDALGRVSNKNQNVAYNYYTYNVRGWLQGINENYFNNNSSGFFFRERLTYDQTTNGLSNAVTPLYNGNISSSTWQGYGTGALCRTYNYSYDNLDRVTNAAFEERSTAGVWSNSATDFTMSGVSYDKNGNIGSMKQMGPNSTGGVPALIDNMTYKYIANSNQLLGVTDAGVVASTDPDFKDDVDPNNPTHLNDYTYDANGNLISDDNKGITTSQPLLYSYLDKPESVPVSGKGTVSYIYDALGNKLEKIVYNSATAATTTTDYVGPYVYINKNLQYVSNEEGRSLPIVSSGILGYQNNYYIKDHLGNVRSVVQAIPSSGPLFVSYLVTHELAQAQVEGYIWSNLDNVRADKPGTLDSSDTKAATLIGTDSTKRIGTSIMLSVMPGDEFSLTTDCYYTSNANKTLISPSNVLSSLFSTLMGGTNSAEMPLSELPRNEATISAAFNNANFINGYNSIYGTAPYDPTMPAGYINYIVLDNNFNVVQSQSGAVQISGSAGTWNTIGTSSNVAIQQAGYLIAYLSSNDGNQVSFDNVQLTYYQGQELEEDHYYPFGLTLQTPATESPAQVNNIKYNSKELQHNEFTTSGGVVSGLELYDYGARMQDPQIGRWLQIDPLTEKIPGTTPYNYAWNNPIARFDPDGAFPFSIHIRSFAPDREFGGWFAGDNRGYSTALGANERQGGVTSRIQERLIADPEKGSLSSKVWSDPSYHPLLGSAKANPTQTISNINTSHDADGNYIQSFTATYAGGNPLVPNSPDINVTTNFVLSENDNTGTLNITANQVGDRFPSEETFIGDAAGNQLFVGVSPADGSPYTSLPGNNKRNMMSSSFTVLLDPSGNFVKVRQGDKSYTIQEWNKMMKSKPTKGEGKIKLSGDSNFRDASME